MTPIIYYTFVLVILSIAASSDSQDGDVCQVYPREYAYRKDSVNSGETVSAKCANYPASYDGKFSTEMYIHCNGTQLRLTDSDFGSEQYSNSDYYVWNAETGNSQRQILFIFPTRVNLTTITLHYYSDSSRSRSRLKFYAVQDDFKIWKSPTARDKSVEVTAVPLNHEEYGHRNVSITITFNTRKILMFKRWSEYDFAVSEVEFFKCSGETTSTKSITDSSIKFTSDQEFRITNKTSTHSTSTYIYENATISTQVNFPQSGETFTIPLVAGVTATVLILLVVTLILVVLLVLWHKRRNTKLKINSNFDEQEASYSTLNRGTKHFSQTQPLNVSVDLYDQIQLSPSTVQSEFISKTECENKYISLQDSHQMNKTCASETNYELLETEIAKPGNPTYAVVDKKKKKPKREESKQSQGNTVTSEKGISHKNSETLTYADPKNSDEREKPNDQQRERKENIEEMYAVVQKKPKKCEEEETAPPIPTYTVEALYTAVQKKPK